GFAASNRPGARRRVRRASAQRRNGWITEALEAAAGPVALAVQVAKPPTLRQSAHNISAVRECFRERDLHELCTRRCATCPPLAQVVRGVIRHQSELTNL